LFLLLTFIIVFLTVTSTEVHLLILLCEHLCQVIAKQFFDIPSENGTINTSAKQGFFALNVS